MSSNNVNQGGGSLHIEDGINLSLYEQGDPLGNGSYGHVFKYKLKDGLDVDLPLWVAVKEIMVTNDEDKDARKTSMRREHQIMKKYKHKNIVSYLGLSTKSGMAYFVMELCLTNLRQFRKGRILTKPEISVIIKKVLSGLCYLHENNVLHRDVKPDNILVSSSHEIEDLSTVHVIELEVKLCDFGHSRLIQSLTNSVTLTAVGTEKYMPPEAREDRSAKNTVTHSTTTFDTFSVGVVTHELATGFLHAKAKSYTNFKKMRNNLGQNCEGENDVLLSFLKDSLHGDKRSRKTPKELLTHSFIQLGEIYLQKEANVSTSKSMPEKTTQKLTMQLHDSENEVQWLRRDLSVKTKEMRTLEEEIKYLQGQLSAVPEHAPHSPSPMQQPLPDEKLGARSKTLPRDQPSQQQHQERVLRKSKSTASTTRTLERSTSSTQPNKRSENPKFFGVLTQVGAKAANWSSY